MEEYVDDIVTYIIMIMLPMIFLINSITFIFIYHLQLKNKINYLDLTLIKHKNHKEFAIYRKPTTSKLSISNTSTQPNLIK